MSGLSVIQSSEPSGPRLTRMEVPLWTSARSRLQTCRTVNPAASKARMRWSRVASALRNGWADGVGSLNYAPRSNSPACAAGFFSTGANWYGL